jgi:hypothetical protein
VARSQNSSFSAALIVGAVIIPFSFGSSAYGQRAANGPEDRSSQFIEQYCYECHNSEDTSAAALFAGLFFDQLDPNDIASAPEKWELIVRKLETGMMPPAVEDRPDAQHKSEFLAHLRGTLDELAASRPNPGRPALHRMNRTEYGNAIRDLLELDVNPTALLPSDDSSFGFDNIAGSLSISPVLLERYVSAAAKISRLAVGDPEIDPYQQKYVVRGDLTQNDHIDGLPYGSRGGMLVEHFFPVDGEYAIRADLVARGGRMFGSNNGREEQLSVMLDGEEIGLYELAEYEAADGIQIRMFVPAGPHQLAAAFIERNYAPVEDVYRPFDFSLFEPAIDGAPNWSFVPHLASFGITGPYDVQGRGETPSRARIFTCRPVDASEEQACAREIVETLATRAYRKPVDVEQISTLMSFYASGREDGSFDDGIEMALRRILASPEFVFRFELDPENAEPGQIYRIDDIELASRLAFFMWSSIPDDELLEIAFRGRLHEPSNLRRQVRRMLADPRSAALIENFGGQWLYLRNLATKGGAVEQFPDFDDNLRQAFRTETELFFESIVREDRNVVDLLTADYTFVNERLAKHYGIADIYGSEFQRVTHQNPARRGLLGQASVLMVTSYPDRTSPVQRGVWVLENIVGAPIPSPPPNVPDLADSAAHDGQPQTLRAQMELHTSRPFCAGCHKIMDPVGFALENFDAVGRWRTEENGSPIVATSKLVDGTEIDGAEGLRNALMNYSERFVQTVTEKLMTYALGRGLEYYDMPAVRAIVDQAEKDEYRFSQIVMGIVASDAFQMRITETLPDETEVVANVSGL